ncbi:MAG: 4-hydroxybenzoate octaprenyltransferase [Gammaproteobacteria bacterium]|nr:4-hydroxybenzoate octaprenyltransferase [Gammaproteobacteria bacterium]
MRVKWNALWRLMRFDKPIGILLLLWPTLWALWIAGEGHPSIKNVLIFCTGVVLMRAAGCIMNDVADRDFDPHVERTRSRPLASGELTVRQALLVFFIVMLLAFGLVLMTNALTIKLAFAGALLASTYPFFKRWTHLPQVVLGLAFGWGVPMAFAAENGYVATIAWLILLINVIWSVIYDTLYAMVDRDDDISIGLKSTAILFGRYDLSILRLLKVVMIALLALLGLKLQFSTPWFAAVTIAAVLFARQQYLVRNRDRDACFRAFLNNNWVGLVIWVGLLANYAVN